jgi:LPXTG-site transpeptidase (sortase) family protein
MKLPISRKKPAIVIVGVLICLTFVVLKTSQSLIYQDSMEPPITRSLDSPDESKNNADTYNWTGTPGEPKRIRIPKINVDAYIQKAGIDQNNQVAVPDNVHLAGWFNGSSLPGSPGLSIIAGHVSGATTDGIFIQLSKLQKGDMFEIVRGDGLVLKYEVIGSIRVVESEAAANLFSQDPATKSQLNLITCSGAYDTVKRRYQDRTIISSILL